MKISTATPHEADGEIAKGTLSRHPYLAGNFRPVRKEYELQACSVRSGCIPVELAGGQYLRNGANAYFPPGPGEGYHL